MRLLDSLLAGLLEGGGKIEVDELHPGRGVEAGFTIRFRSADKQPAPEDEAETYTPTIRSW